MRKLTHKEEEIMKLFWENGGMFVKDMLETLPNPKPHINTVSTQVRILEKDGFLDHKQYGGSFQYFPFLENAGKGSGCSGPDGSPAFPQR